MIVLLIHGNYENGCNERVRKRQDHNYESNYRKRSLSYLLSVEVEIFLKLSPVLEVKAMSTKLLVNLCYEISQDEGIKSMNITFQK